MPEQSELVPAPERFHTTHWSLVARAGDHPSPEAADALAQLCGTYWYPLYAYIRRQCRSAEQAEELTQEFILRLLDRDFLTMADPKRGKFRSFLIVSCKHFLANEHSRHLAQKRGGGRTVLSLDFSAAETRYRLEPCDEMDAEKLFERRWALALLEQVLDQLRNEYALRGQQQLFERLEPILAQQAKTPLGQIAAELNTSEAAVKKAAQRMRGRYREILRERIAQTLGSTDEVDQEIRHLFEVLGG